VKKKEYKFDKLQYLFFYETEVTDS